MKFVVFDTIHHVIFCISTINQLTYINLKSSYGLNTVFKGTMLLASFFEFKGKNVKIGTIFSSHEPIPRTKKHKYLLSFNILYYFLRHLIFVSKEIYPIAFMQRAYVIN